MAAKASSRKQRPTSRAANGGSVEPVNQVLCDRVRSLRKSKGWTLEQLASLSGVSRSMLSQIERGAASPTLGVAFRVAQAFGMSLGDLVQSPQPRPRIDLIRASDRGSLFRDDSHCRIRTLSPLHLEKEVEFYELTLKVGGSLVSAPHVAGTREFLVIEQGAVQLTSADESTELESGDSAHYPADVSHRIDNRAEGETVAFLVVIYDRSPTRRS
jgi:transcriptional regulator with XRE-family HTH domain